MNEKIPQGKLAGFFIEFGGMLAERGKRMEWEKARVYRVEISTERILAIGDIHGNLGLFKSLLCKLQYCPEKDTLVILGDLVQKGPENLGVLQLVMQLAQKKNVYVLLGNNDSFVEDGADEDVFSHTAWFKERSLLGEMALAAGEKIPETVEETRILRWKMRDAFPDEHNFLRELPHILETDSFLFAHAGLKDENLQNQDVEFVLSTPRFHETVSHQFSKMLLTGHWPTGNYRNDRMSNAPIYHETCNVLSIDGGNGVKRCGQLNGVILNQKTGGWSWTYADRFPEIQAPCSQKAKSGVVITWPENEVELLKRGKDISRCRSKKNGTLLDIPNEFLYQDEAGCYTDDITNICLEVEKGESLSLIGAYENQFLVRKNGETGWLIKSDPASKSG